MSHPACIICCQTERNYLFTSHAAQIDRCPGCGLLYRSNPRSQLQVAFETDPVTELDAANRYASIIVKAGLGSGCVLVLAESANHPLAGLLRDSGCKVFTRLEDVASQSDPQSLDAVVLLYCLDITDNPLDLLASCRGLLKSDGLVLATVPLVDSWAARFFGQGWTHWRNSNNYYFGRKQLQLLLERAGFAKIWITPDYRLYSYAHILERASQHSQSAASNCLKALISLLPSGARQKRKRVASSGAIVSARPKDISPKTSLSIIMPVFNEKTTFATTLESVIEKRIQGIDEKEIIVVESNSTDGTKELVKSFEERAGVKIVYEDKPQGKGHAVRTGLTHATGDIVLIQDADAEYDINDYDELVKPLVEHRELFVLGSRHNGGFKMRTFTNEPALSLFFNFGQVLFTTLMNVLYGQKMTDPFTMYKVFRRECIYGLNFECNRFDFDHELVIKLLLKGYKPSEIPVNYSSRSYEEGKKVSMVADPLLWIKANFKFRFASPFTSEARERHALARKGSEFTIDFSPSARSDDHAILAHTIVSECSATNSSDSASADRVDSQTGGKKGPLPMEER